jgi:AcrR family transcriptional regulator
MFIRYINILEMSIRYRMDKKSDLSNLTRQNWIDRGLEVLAKSGVEAVRVEPLAKLMGVTKGSFYWHFKNREDFLEAILQNWIAAQTNSIIERVDNTDGDAMTKLRYLFELAIEDDGRIENAIRAWSSTDARIANVLEQVDRRRLDYTRDLFLAVGFEPLEAMVRARMIYYSLVGESTLGINRDRSERLAEIRLQHTILTSRP